ncbi:hypothetical protein ABEB36_000712 [Hypothenemus hampei]|uniref:Phosphopantothenoylcysteine decarboxylase n=1 Tax=Hypothenemus hampei TaxID=57062 RepID=A0ABD1FC71_HYPHA
MVNVLLACTGSVATIKLPELVEKLFEEFKHKNMSLKIRVITSEKAKHFFNVRKLQEDIDVFSDEDEWNAWTKRGDPVLHIELGRWADVLLLAPLDANSLAKIANGICDNILLCTIRAWDLNKPLIFCPAMNTKMYEHPITNGQLTTLKAWGYIEVPVIQKTLICGDTGLGAMAEVTTIVDKVLEVVS